MSDVVAITKQCQNCGEEKPLVEFHRQGGNRQDLRTQCGPCRVKIDAKRRKDRQEGFDLVKVDRDKVKKCSGCQTEKAGWEFHINRSNSSGLQTACKKCMGEAVKKWRTRGKYGLNPGDYERMVEEQGNLCGICLKEDPGLDQYGNPARWRIDHNHQTGKVRGLLCSNCNVGLGLFQDNPENLEAAATWLRDKGGEG